MDLYGANACGNGFAKFALLSQTAKSTQSKYTLTGNFFLAKHMQKNI